MPQHRRVDGAKSKKLIAPDREGEMKPFVAPPQPTLEDAEKSQALRDRVQAIRDGQKRKRDQTKNKLL